jgi:hypothetical protein
MPKSVICQFKIPRWIKSFDVESRGSDCCFDNVRDTRDFVRCWKNGIEDKLILHNIFLLHTGFLRKIMACINPDEIHTPLTHAC